MQINPNTYAIPLPPTMDEIFQSIIENKPIPKETNPEAVEYLHITRDLDEEPVPLFNFGVVCRITDSNFTGEIIADIRLRNTEWAKHLTDNAFTIIVETAMELYQLNNPLALRVFINMLCLSDTFIYDNHDGKKLEKNLQVRMQYLKDNMDNNDALSLEYKQLKHELQLLTEELDVIESKIPFAIHMKGLHDLLALMNATKTKQLYDTYSLNEMLQLDR